MPDKVEGLTTAEAKERLEKYGPNALPEKPPPSDLRIFLRQLKSPLVYILLFAGVITFLLKHYSDTAIITLAVFINTILGFLQERKANRALYALKELIHPQAGVYRDGKRQKVGIENVVPGDICILDTGDKVPADGKIVEANRFFISEAILTGESVPVGKSEGDKAFMGTVVTAGKGLLEVSLTGGETEIGKIAKQVQEVFEDTPLRRQLAYFSKQLTFLVAGLTTFVFMVGLITGRDIVEIFTTSVALAVSSIPEGLLVGLTVVLAIGMQKILKRKGLVRNLISAETLGGVTTICVDKTGTLTAGKMQVVEVIGSKRDIAKQGVIANDLDDPILIALWEWAGKKLSHRDLKGENVDVYVRKHKRLDSIPFNSADRFFASLNQVGAKKRVVFVNGAPEFLMDWSNLSNREKKEITKKIDELTEKGMRVFGMARKEVSAKKSKLAENDIKKGLSWAGVIAFSDPLRAGVSDAFSKTKSAGIKTLVITGDYTQTAKTVMKQMGIEVSEKEIMLGTELEKTTKEHLAKRLKGGGSIKLFARTTPEQKLKIVEALKENGEVVAMMGDGVNDAPALNRADIGIVVGDATDVAKETADLVLLDSNFATIVAAVEEGRGIFNNLRKIILYLMSDAFSEIIAVVGTIIFRLPLPITAAQILWINLVSDGFPHLALTVDPKSPGIMEEKPRPTRESIVMPWMKVLIGIVSLYSGLSALIVFIYILNTLNDEVLARSVSFLILGVNSLVYVFSVRTLKEPFWKSNPLDNRWLILAVFAGFALQLFPFITSVGREFFNVSILPVNYWVLVFIISFVMFIMIEVSKHFFKGRLFN